MKRDMDCPRCGKYFECDEWDTGQCPRCQNGYWFYEDYVEESGFTDCYASVEWDDFHKNPDIYEENHE
jgi:hypothetical protein